MIVFWILAGKQIVFSYTKAHIHKYVLFSRFLFATYQLHIEGMSKQQTQ